MTSSGDVNVSNSDITDHMDAVDEEWRFEVSKHQHTKDFTKMFYSCIDRVEKDSSNDEDMFEDSSAEGSQATCDLEEVSNGSSRGLQSKKRKSVTSKKNVPGESTPTQAASSKVKTASSKKVLNIMDEEVVLKMTDEERKYSETYMDGKV